MLKIKKVSFDIPKSTYILIKKYIKNDDNHYNTISEFIRSAIFEKMERIKK